MKSAFTSGALFSLMCAMTLTGANVPLAKVIVADIPLYAFLFFRFALSTAALAVLVRWEAGPKLRDMSPRARVDMAAMSLVGMVGYTILIFEGVRRTAAADAGIITATLPAVVAILSVVLLRDRLQPRQWAAVALAVFGLMLVQAGAGAAGRTSLLGNALVVGAILCEASFVIVGKRLAPPYRPVRLALGANVVGLALSFPLMVIEGRVIELLQLPPIMALACTWYVLSASVIALWLWYRGLPHVPTWLAGLATAALPIAALAVSVGFLGEPLGSARLFGAALVLASIGLGALAARPASRV